MLTFEEELTGNDLKKWADWSVGFFYWSPSISQVYAELKKLEESGSWNRVSCPNPVCEAAACTRSPNPEPTQCARGRGKRL